jgi:hypothetical protein
VFNFLKRLLATNWIHKRDNAEEVGDIMICTIEGIILIWILYVLCSKFVTNLYQESLCLLLASVLAGAKVVEHNKHKLITIRTQFG